MRCVCRFPPAAVSFPTPRLGYPPPPRSCVCRQPVTGGMPPAAAPTAAATAVLLLLLPPHPSRARPPCLTTRKRSAPGRSGGGGSSQPDSGGAAAHARREGRHPDVAMRGLPRSAAECGGNGAAERCRQDDSGASGSADTRREAHAVLRSRLHALRGRVRARQQLPSVALRWRTGVRVVLPIFCFAFSIRVHFLCNLSSCSCNSYYSHLSHNVSEGTVCFLNFLFK